jgi:NTE family protein
MNMERYRLKSSLVALTAVLCPLATGTSVADPGGIATETAVARPRVALVLSGGGARGLAHIGVIRELERMRIPVDCIVGTSMGGIVGGVYASGLPIDELERSAREIDWTLAFQDKPDRSAMRARRKKDENGHFAQPEFGVRNGEIISPAGVVYGQNLAEIMARLTDRARGIERFDQLPIPYRAIATDIATGLPVVLDHGQLPLAMRATMSVPAVMAPIELDDKLLVDGGLVDNLPVGTARALCGDVVIAVNLGTPLLSRKEIGSALAVGVQMVNILTEQNVRASLAMLRAEDVLLTPKLDDLSSGSFDQADSLIEAGEQSVKVMAEELARLRVSPEQFSRWKSGHDRREDRAFKVGAIRIGKLSAVNPAVLSAEIEPAYRQGDTTKLGDATRRLFQRGDFERVQLGFTEEAGHGVAIIDAKEKSWGPHYLRFGLNMTVQSGESTSFNAVVGSTRTWLNSYGGRWQNILQVGTKNAAHSEFLQPIAPGSPLFIAPRILGTIEQTPIYIGEAQVARFSRTQALAALDVGTEFGRSGAMRLGTQFGREKRKADIGPVMGSSDWLPIRAVTALVDIDAMNKAHFPTQGHRALFDFHHSYGGGDENARFRRAILDISAAETWRQNTFNFQLMAGKVQHTGPSTTILFDLIPMGGFQRLSAYPVNRFRVNEVGFGRVGYQRNVPPLLGLHLGGIVTQAYFGGSLEAARIRQDYDYATADGVYKSASIFVGADTILGPAAVSLGIGPSGARTIWLSIGVPWTPQ